MIHITENYVKLLHVIMKQSLMVMLYVSQ